MALPRLHSCTWSDKEERRGRQPAARGSVVAGPQSLKDIELHLWVTYPDTNPRGKRSDKRDKRRRKAPRLWAVVIIEEVRRMGDFSYEVALRRIFKSGERTIQVSVTNDPRDQSDDAKVFGFVSPRPRDLAALEEYLIHVAAMRMYDAIAETWDCSDAEETRRGHLPEPHSVACHENTMAQVLD